jgi:hypothetical protein
MDTVHHTYEPARGGVTRVVNIRSLPLDQSEWPADHVYIGRANRSRGVARSKWHNPYVVCAGYSREQAVEDFEGWITDEIRHEPERWDLSELRGKTLVCWCAPRLCHGDVLARLADAREGSK